MGEDAPPVRAKLLAWEGRTGEATVLAREAVRLAAPIDILTMSADALLDLAEILRLSGPSAEADAAARHALALYERKEDRVSVARARPHPLAAGTPTTRPLPANGGA